MIHSLKTERVYKSINYSDASYIEHKHAKYTLYEGVLTDNIFLIKSYS